ncbi:MAG TPA: cyclic nucleotide-binding domain-containing protein [Oscillatoriaceae cyanobacterium]
MEMTLVPLGFYELPIFKSLTPAEVDEIGRLAMPVNFEKGEVLFRENSPSNHVDIVWEGAVEICKHDREGVRRTIAIVGAKSVVGETSLMSALDRSCTGIAVTDVQSYRIRREDFVALLDRGSLAAYKVIYNLAQVLSGRLRTVDEKLVEMMHERPAAEGEARHQEFSDFGRKLFTEWAF